MGAGRQALCWELHLHGPFPSSVPFCYFRFSVETRRLGDLEWLAQVLTEPGLPPGSQDGRVQAGQSPTASQADAGQAWCFISRGGDLAPQILFPPRSPLSEDVL